MPAPPTTTSTQDRARLAALAALEILDTPPEPAFDRLTRLAALVCDTPTAAVSLIDEHRQWFKSRVGFDDTETPIADAFCAVTIERDELLLVEDASRDSRFGHYRPVTAPGGVRFYAGLPLSTRDGHRVGTLCVFDSRPRTLDERQHEALRLLAQTVSEELALHAERREDSLRAATLDALVEALPDGVVACDTQGRIVVLNEVAREWHDLGPIVPVGDQPAQRPSTYHLYRSDRRTPLQPAEVPLGRALQGQRLRDEALSILTPGLPPRDISCNGNVVRNTRGELLGAVLTMRDITQHKHLVEQLAADKRHLELVLEGTGAATGWWDLHTGEIRFDEAWATMLGYTLEELGPMNVARWRDFTHPADLQNLEAQLHDYLAGHTPYYEAMVRNRHRDGHWVWVHARGKTVSWDEQGRPRWLAGIHTDVSRIKRAEADIERARRYVDALIGASTDVAIMVTDPEGLLTVFNSGAEQLLGRSAAEVIGHCTPERFHDPLEMDRRAQELHKQLGRPVKGFATLVADVPAGQSTNRIATYLRTDGLARTVRLSVSSIVGAEDEHVGYVFIAVDLTDRLTAEKRAFEHQSRFQSAFASAPNGIALVGLDGRWLDVNAALCQMLGYSRDEMLQSDFQSITYHEDLDSDLKLMKQVLEGHIGEYKLVKRYIHKSGRLVHGLLAVVMVLNELGEPWYFVSQVVDITELHQTQQRLAASVTYLDAVFSSVMDAIVTVDGDGRITGVNRAATLMFGHSQSKLRGRPLESFLAPDVHGVATRLPMFSGQPVRPSDTYEMYAVRFSGERFPIELRASRIEHSARASWACVIRDLTEARRIEEMKSEFVSTVSHELRTPLTSISGALGLLLSNESGELPDSVRPLIEIAHRNSWRLGVIVNDLLDLDKLIAGKMAFELAPCPAAALLRDAITSNLGYAAKHDITLSLQQAEPGTVQVDAMRFAQVMANLLSNAVKFSPAGGQVELRGKPIGRGYEFSVTDHGPGIPEAYRPRLFQPFTQADASDTRSRQGTGLGLAICKQLVEHMGGEIGYATEIDVGTTFWFQLPMVGPPATE